MTRTLAAQISGPVPSPRIKGITGSSGTCSVPWLIVIFSPRVGAAWEAVVDIG